MKRLKSLLVASLLVCDVGLSRAQNDIQELHIVEGQLMVLIDGKTTIEEWCAKMQEAGVIGMEPLGQLSQSMNLWLVEYPAANMPAEDALLLAARERTTRIVQFNHTNLELRNTPNDPLFSDQWSLFNDGSNGGSGTADIDALDAWDITTGGLTARGDTIVVAVIDGGFQMTHEDLEANMFVNHHEVPGNGLDDDGNGYVDDVQGWNAYTNNGTQSLSNHGTHVAGTVGAVGNNNTGVTGVNWDVKVMAISGSSSLESTVVAAYSYALDMRRLYNQTGGEKGAYVVATNSSFGVNYGDPIDYPLWCAMYDSLGMQGVLSAGATANLNINVDVTGDIPTACGSNFLISVTNSTSSDVKNSGAAYGVTTIDLAAPGTNIHSTTNSGYGSLTGTSMATPHVAGAVALMYSAVCENVIDGFGNNHPGLAVYVKEKLLNEGVDQLASLQGLLLTEGRLNLYQAVRSVADSCITVQLSVLDSDCGMCNGSIQSNIVGGVAPYQYFWSMGDTTASISGLCAGSYNLTVVDAENDSSMASAVVSDIGGPSLSFNVQDLSCFNSGDGAVSLNGGDAYLWSDGGTSALRNDLSAGTYFVSATDNSGCTTVVSIELHQPSEILVTFEAQIPVPYNASNGVLVAHVSGGLGPYSYTWSGGAGSDSVLNGLDVGLYSLTVEDAAGCIDTTSYFLGYPAGLGEHVPVTSILFPNPTRGQVELNGMPGGVSVVQVFDHRGTLCYATKVSGTSASLQLGGLAAGPYFLRLRSSEGVTVHRLYIVE